MTKQELREGIAEWLWENRAGETTVQDWVDAWSDLPENRKQDFRKDADKFILYIHSQGLVRKVERELPLMFGTVESYVIGFQKMREDGYEAVESLMGDR